MGEKEWRCEVTETFRKRPGTLRGLHPTHSVAVVGTRAEDLIRDHAKAPTACGKGTPFGRLAEWGGKVLLLGVDQDRNTLLHTAEDYANLPFLSTRTAKYRDPADGEVKEITLDKFPGPHRNFIGLDPLFREAGVMKIGKIGKAVCRLMDAEGTVRVAVEALRQDPAAVLCDNPACADCVQQMGFIRKAALDREDFMLAARIDEIPDASELTSLLWGYGITAIEIGPAWLKRILKNGIEPWAKSISGSELSVTGIDISEIRDTSKAFEFAVKVGCSNAVMTARSEAELKQTAGKASAAGISLLVRNSRGSLVDVSAKTASLKGTGVGLGFDPSEFAAMREMPFLSVYYHRIPKSLVRHLYIKDGTFDGRLTEPGFGNGEIKELISILRCRSFDGPMVIWPRESIASSCEAFWRLFETL
ncbi:MAG: AAC(3) family N-acetyltransferase [Armatimonadetes bacterium]|nr:AAC(3) family N-acetyltransferase [Armatimonadota bacterium]